MGRFDDGTEPGRCTCMSKSSRKRCGLPVVPGTKACWRHGGRGGAPIIHGRRSKAMRRFRAAFEEARKDPSLMDLRDTLAQLDIVVQESARRLDEADCPNFRRRASELFREARAATEPSEAARYLTELGALLDEGVAEDEALENFARAVERFAKRLESAWGIKLSAAQAVNARDLVAVLTRFADIVMTEAPDASGRILRRIDAEVLGYDALERKVIDAEGAEATENGGSES